jgi:hypothetical protein
MRLTRPIKTGLTHCVAGRFFALGSAANTLLDALPKPLAHLTIRCDERRAEVPAGAALGHQREGWFAGFALDRKQVILIQAVALRL